MSALIEHLIRQAAVAISNPAKDRVTTPDWLEFYNATARDIGARVYAKRYTATFDLQVDSDYDYPDEMTRMVALWVTDTPLDLDSFRLVGEIREDQFRDRVQRGYPKGTLPEEYFADSTIFRVIPKPEAIIVGGGKLEFWGLPDEILNATSTTMPFPDFLREWVVEGMVIHALRKQEQYLEARDRYASWVLREPEYAKRLEDRSEDRRPRLVPRSEKRRYGGMV